MKYLVLSSAVLLTFVYHAMESSGDNLNFSQPNSATAIIKHIKHLTLPESEKETAIDTINKVYKQGWKCSQEEDVVLNNKVRNIVDAYDTYKYNKNQVCDYTNTSIWRKVSDGMSAEPRFKRVDGKKSDKEQQVLEEFRQQLIALCKQLIETTLSASNS